VRIRSLIFCIYWKQILGAGMSERMWDVTIKHAKTCEKGNKYYVFRGPNFTIFLNSICQLVKADINGQSFPGSELSSFTKVTKFLRNCVFTSTIKQCEKLFSEALVDTIIHFNCL